MGFISGAWDKKILLLKQHGNGFPMLVTPGSHISVIATVEVAVANTKKVSKAAPSLTSACSCDRIRAKGVCRNNPTGAMAIAWLRGSQQMEEHRLRLEI